MDAVRAVMCRIDERAVDRRGSTMNSCRVSRYSQKPRMHAVTSIPTFASSEKCRKPERATRTSAMKVIPKSRAIEVSRNGCGSVRNRHLSHVTAATCHSLQPQWPHFTATSVGDMFVERAPAVDSIHRSGRSVTVVVP
jgi:hypothetical protein